MQKLQQNHSPLRSSETNFRNNSSPSFRYGDPEIRRDDDRQGDQRMRQQELSWSTGKPAVVLATIAVQVAVAEVKFQNTSDNPFQSRPASVTFLVIALSIYGFAAAQTRPIKLDGEQQKILTWRIIYYYNRLLNSLVQISGVVCQACIASFFIPNGPVWNVYVACASTLCVGVAVWAILRNFAPSCVVRLLPCMGPTGSSGGSEKNDGVSDCGNNGRNKNPIAESNESPVSGFDSLVRENQSSSQQDHSTQANGRTANTANGVSPHIIRSSPNKGTMSKAHPDPDEKPIQSPNPLKAAGCQGLDTPSVSQMPSVSTRASYPV